MLQPSATAVAVPPPSNGLPGGGNIDALPSIVHQNASSPSQLLLRRSCQGAISAVDMASLVQSNRVGLCPVGWGEIVGAAAGGGAEQFAAVLSHAVTKLHAAPNFLQSK